MALPPNVTYGTVVGTFLTAVADTIDDPDRDPQGVAATGLKFRFSADLDPAIVRDATSTPPTMFALAPIDCTVGADGSLLGPDGAPGVKLVASTNTALTPNGWTWRVALSGTGFPSLQFSFQLDPAATVDLATVLQVPANPGSTLNAWLQAVKDAQDARDAAAASAASVPSRAELSATYLPLWKPNTTYAAGQFALSPTGQTIQAISAFTSGASFNASKWTVVSGGTGSTATLGADGNYYLASGAGGSGAPALGSDGNYYLAA